MFCNICGKWKKGLAVHVNKAHNLYVKNFKEMVGLNSEAPLTSPFASERMSITAKEFFKDPMRRKEILKNLAKGTEKMKQMKIRKKRTTQYFNKVDTCPAQILSKLGNVSHYEAIRYLNK